MKKMILISAVLTAMGSFVFAQSNEKSKYPSDEYIYGYNQASEGENNNCNKHYWSSQRDKYDCNKGYDDGTSDKINSNNGNANANSYNNQ